MIMREVNNFGHFVFVCFFNVSTSFVCTLSPDFSFHSFDFITSEATLKYEHRMLYLFTCMDFITFMGY